MATNQTAPILYTKTTLAALLGITEDEAQQLMQDESFPASPITGTAYAGKSQVMGAAQCTTCRWDQQQRYL